MRSIIVYFIVMVTAGFIVLLVPDISLATQERRIALVIGNGHYKSAPLANPVNDATDIAVALKKSNFTVMKALNATREEMRRVIRVFGDKIKRGGIGLFYYAGHGIQVKGENYLVPIDAKVQMEDEVEDECLKVSSVLRKMETAGNRLNIIILDACRNNPFGRSFRSSRGGLAKMDAPTGSILAYATAPGSVAADGTDRNGLYTSMLLKHIMKPGLKIEDFFKRVRIDVVNASGKRQIPWESSSLMGDFYFNPERGITVAGNPSTEPQRPEEETPKYSSLDPAVTKSSEIGRDGRFIAYANGVVKDTKTGLEWIAGPDRGTTWYEARSWVQNLSVDGGGWRMPKREELKTLCQKGTGRRNMTPFFKITGWRVWSETVASHTSSQAYCFSFFYGDEYSETRSNSSELRGFAVRSRK